MPADELDCLLCDEVADPAPLQALLRRPLTTVDEALHRAVEAAWRRLAFRRGCFPCHSLRLRACLR
jgi:hypothetical protein